MDLMKTVILLSAIFSLSWGNSCLQGLPPFQSAGGIRGFLSESTSQTRYEVVFPDFTFTQSGQIARLEGFITGVQPGLQSISISFVLWRITPSFQPCFFDARRIVISNQHYCSNTISFMTTTDTLQNGRFEQPLLIAVLVQQGDILGLEVESSDNIDLLFSPDVSTSVLRTNDTQSQFTHPAPLINIQLVNNPCLAPVTTLVLPDTTATAPATETAPVTTPAVTTPATETVTTPATETAIPVTAPATTETASTFAIEIITTTEFEGEPTTGFTQTAPTESSSDQPIPLYLLILGSCLILGLALTVCLIFIIILVVRNRKPRQKNMSNIAKNESVSPEQLELPNQLEAPYQLVSPYYSEIASSDTFKLPLHDTNDLIQNPMYNQIGIPNNYRKDFNMSPNSAYGTCERANPPEYNMRGNPAYTVSIDMQRNDAYTVSVDTQRNVAYTSSTGPNAN